MKPLQVFLTGLMAILLIAVIFSYFVMLLWNGCLVPAIDGVNQISWLQSLGLTVLFSLLFKSSAKSS